MQRFLRIIVLAAILGPLGLVVVGPVDFAYAQLPADFVDDGEPLEPAGSRGGYSRDQGEILALRIMPGEVLQRGSYKIGGNKRCRTVVDVEEVTKEVCRRSSGRAYYEYVILVPDGSVYEVEIRASNGKLYEIEVEHLSDRPVFPFEVMAEADLRAIALAKVDEEEWGGRVPKVLDTKIDVFQRKAVYVIDVRKNPNKARVTLDARTGEVLDYKQL